MKTSATCTDLRTGPVFPSRENTCAIVVTYFPDAGLCDRLERTKAQVAHVIIVDNSSDEKTFEHVRAASSGPGIDLIRNPTNLGIAAALNQGLNWASSKGYPWVLLLDQDTIPEPGMMATLIRAFEEFPGKDRLAVIGSSRVLNPVTNPKPKKGKSWEITETVITSGSLLAMAAALKIGPFREDFFIDFVDFEFCLRARRMGFEIVEILVPVMQHFVGDPGTVRFLWWEVHAYNHRPWRSYYMIRNFMALVREYAFKDPWWIFRMSCGMAKILTITLLLEEARIAKFRYVVNGFYDGLLGHFTRRVS